MSLLVNLRGETGDAGLVLAQPRGRERLNNGQDLMEILYQLQCVHVDDLQ